MLESAAGNSVQHSPGGEEPSDEEFPSLHQAAKSIQQRGYRPTWYQNKRRPPGRQQPLSKSLPSTAEEPVLEPPVQPESPGPRQTMPEEESLRNITNKATSVKKSLNVDSPSFTPAQLQPGGKKSSFSSQAANAVPFTPKATPNGTLISRIQFSQPWHVAHESLRLH